MDACTHMQVKTPSSSLSMSASVMGKLKSETTHTVLHRRSFGGRQEEKAGIWELRSKTHERQAVQTGTFNLLLEENRIGKDC